MGSHPMPAPVSMAQEHDASGFTPTSVTIADDTTTTAPEDYYNYTNVAKQPHYFPHYSADPVYTNYYPSSPETRISMSGSSTGSYSYSIPVQSPQRTGNWDSAVAMASSPLPPPTAVLDPYAEATRAEAGFITCDYKTKINHSGLSWSAEGSLSDGGHGPGRNSSRSVRGGVHDVPTTVAVYKTAEDKEGGRDREPNAVLVLVSLARGLFDEMYMRAHADYQIAPPLRANPTVLNLHLHLHLPRRSTRHINIPAPPLSTNRLFPLNLILKTAMPTPRTSTAQTRPTCSVQYQPLYSLSPTFNI